MKYRLADNNDKNSLANMHYICGKRQCKGYMYQLGIPFLKVYYDILLNEKNSIVLIAENEKGVITGFISGTLAAEEHLLYLRRYKMRILFSLIPKIIQFPYILRGLINRLEFIYKKSNANKYSITEGPRIEYWAWDTNETTNYSIFMLKTYLNIVFSKGAHSIKGEIDIENNNIFTIHRRVGAKILHKYKLNDGRTRAIIEFVNNHCIKGFLVRSMAITDIERVVNIHIHAFPQFFLTELGKGFIRELYKDFVINESSICKVVLYDSIIMGFVVGSLKPRSLFKKLLIKNGYKFLWYTLNALVRNPYKVTIKLVYAFRYRGEPPSNFQNPALLSSIGVDPQSERKGIGKSLLHSFCDEAFLCGADCVYLTTDKINNDKVNNFYIMNGFQLESVIIQTGNREMNRYIKLPNN